jgi:hypothetical protein
VGAQIAKRFGELLPVSLGLAAVTGGLVLFATATAASGYGHYVLAMIIVSSGIGMAMSPATSASMRELPPAMAGVGSAVNDTTRNMGSVLGVAVFGSITASVFASRMASFASAGHKAAGSVGAAAEAAHHAGGAYGADLLHAAASAFVTGADHAVIAGAIATAAGVLIAVVTLRVPARAAAVQASAAAEILAREDIPARAEVPARVEVPAPSSQMEITSVSPGSTGRLNRPDMEPNRAGSESHRACSSARPVIP